MDGEGDRAEFYKQPSHLFEARLFDGIGPRVTVRVSDLPGNLIDKMVKSALTQGICGIPFAVRKRFGACQPVEDILRQNLEGESDIALDPRLAFVKTVEPNKQTFF